MIRSLFVLALACVAVSPVHARGNAEAGKAKSTACAACHGATGVSEVTTFPVLAGQHRDYLYHALKEYKSGKRKNPIMAGQVASLSDADMADLAKYYAQLPGLKLKY